MKWLYIIDGKFPGILSSTFLGIEIWRILAAGLVLFFVLLVKKALVNSVILLLGKIPSKAGNAIDAELSAAVKPPANLLVFTAGLYFIIRILGFKVTDESFTGHLIRSLIIFSIFWAVFRTAGIIARLIEKASKKTHTALDKLMVPFVDKGIKAIVVVFAVSVIAKEWKYDLGALLTGLGLGGLAFALAAQETLENLFGGLAIMLDKPFNVGDYIQCDGLEGTVEDIGFRSTRIRTSELTLVTVPNSSIAKASITNCSRREKRRVKFTLQVKYCIDTERMNELLNRIREMLKKHESVYSDTVSVYLDGFGANGYELMVAFFTKTADYQEYLAIKENVNLKIMQILDELGIEIARTWANVYPENR